MCLLITTGTAYAQNVFIGTDVRAAREWSIANSKYCLMHGCASNDTGAIQCHSVLRKDCWRLISPW